MKGERDEKQMCTKGKRLYLLAVFNEHYIPYDQPHAIVRTHTHTHTKIAANNIWCSINSNKEIP